MMMMMMTMMMMTMIYLFCPKTLTSVDERIPPKELGRQEFRLPYSDRSLVDQTPMMKT